MTKDEFSLRADFHTAAMQQGRCAGCGYIGPFMEAHHILAKSFLKRQLSRKGQPVATSVLWDPRNALALCSEGALNRCHPRHTLHFMPLSRLALPQAAWEFAEEHQIEWALDRYYPEPQAA